MSLLTDDEIDELQKAWIANGMSGSRSFARAIEAAILAKLASAELPEPFPAGYIAQTEYFYTADQLRQAFAQGAASQLAQEPTALMYQHDETGRVGFLEAWGPVDLFQKANPRLRIVASLYTRKEAK